MLSESMEWVCNYCGGIGELAYPAHQIEDCTLIICSHCSKPSAYVWCDTCGMGGQITETTFLNSPSKWQCRDCGSEYELSDVFYQNKLVFTPEDFVDVDDLKEEQDLRTRKYITVAWIRYFVEFWENQFGLFLLASFALALCSMIAGTAVMYLNTRLPQFINNIFLYGLATVPIIMVVNLIAWIVPKVFWVLYKMKKIRA